jgi:hypothetical protein
MKNLTSIRAFFRLHEKRTRITIFILIALFSLLPNILFAQMEWICATDSAEWSARRCHTSVVFDNKIWVLVY